MHSAVVFYQTDVVFDVSEHLSAPFFAFTKCCNGSYRGKNGRLIQFVYAEPLIETMTQCFVRNDGIRADNTGDIKCFRRCSKCDADLGSPLRHARKGMMLMSEEGHIAVNLITDDQ